MPKMFRNGVTVEIVEDGSVGTENDTNVDLEQPTFIGDLPKQPSTVKWDSRSVITPQDLKEYITAAIMLFQKSSSGQGWNHPALIRFSGSDVTVKNEYNDTFVIEVRRR